MLYIRRLCAYFIIFIFFCAFLIGALILGALTFSIHHQVINLSTATLFRSAMPSVLLDDQGVEWARFELDRREPIEITHIPRHVINAFVAAEDWRFFHHSGISIKGIIRSLFVNIYHGRAVQGASTITQQLVKLILSDLNKTITRKIKEQIIALAIEQQYTKEQILQVYLNNIYFGCGIYGVQAACQRFWSIDISAISLEQAATLAGIVQNPAHYCPLTCPLSAQKRRNTILTKMHRLHMIDQQEYDAALHKPLFIHEHHADACALHLKETIRLTLESLIGKKKLYHDGLIIKTTINKQYQTAAEQAFISHISHLRTSINSHLEGALISMEVSSGALKALVGGFNFKSSQFNRALRARRQIGSTIKPLIYAAALQAGFTFDQVAVDEPLTVQFDQKSWSPKNYNNIFSGPITLAQALATSCNTISTKLLLALGAHPIIHLAEQAGIKGPFHTYPSLALGCIDATLLEVTGMFNIFANHGIFVEPYVIESVKDQWGQTIYTHIPCKRTVLPPAISDQVAHVLQNTSARLRRIARIPSEKWPCCEVICKTGTTNDSRTCWFVGSTPEITTAIYVGNDDNSPLGTNIFPVRTAFPLWITVNEHLKPQETIFAHDPSLQEIWIDKYQGSMIEKNDPNAIALLIKS